MSVALRSVTIPFPELDAAQPKVPAAVFATRADQAYAQAGVDWLVIYADREHLGNVMFLSGFDPRFEEAFLLLGPGGRRILIAGNESESYAALAPLPGLAILLGQTLSLMGQDRSKFPRLADRFRDAGLKPGDRVGLVGWKYLEPEEDEDRSAAFFVPAAYVRMLQQVVGKEGHFQDATSILMHPATGLRSIIDVHQIAAFEWSAIRCSQAVWQIVSGIREGDSEFDAAGRMGYTGDPLNVHTMLASAAPGEVIVGLRSPTNRRLTRGDGVTTALGMWGALTSRAGLLDTANEEFLAKARGYFLGLVKWYESADIGVTGGELFQVVVEQLAKGGLSSALNPGHLTGHEEWSHSPVRPGSSDQIGSGMPFQVDVIPTPLPAGQALNCEDPVTFADAVLRRELATQYPSTFARIEARRCFVRDMLGVDIKPSILPLSATPLCLPPFWLRSNELLTRD